MLDQSSFLVSLFIRFQKWLLRFKKNCVPTPIPSSATFRNRNPYPYSTRLYDTRRNYPLRSQSRLGTVVRLLCRLQKSFLSLNLNLQFQKVLISRVWLKWKSQLVLRSTPYDQNWMWLELWFVPENHLLSWRRKLKVTTFFLFAT